MKQILLFILLILSSSLFSSKPRLYQFVTEEKNESFIIVEGGSIADISIHTKGVELTGGYSFFLAPQQGFNLSSDLYYGVFDFTEKLSLNMGVGGGLIFNSTVDDGFSSDIYLRFPLRLRYNNYFFKLNPMPGISMFKKIPELKLSVSLSLGYMFDLYRGKDIKKTADEDEDL